MTIIIAILAGHGAASLVELFMPDFVAVITSFVVSGLVAWRLVREEE